MSGRGFYHVRMVGTGTKRFESSRVLGKLLRLTRFSSPRRPPLCWWRGIACGAARVGLGGRGSASPPCQPLTAPPPPRAPRLLRSGAAGATGAAVPAIAPRRDAQRCLNTRHPGKFSTFRPTQPTQPTQSLIISAGLIRPAATLHAAPRATDSLIHGDVIPLRLSLDCIS